MQYAPLIGILHYVLRELLKAIKDYDLKRIISFHSRVNRAEAFTTDMQNTMQWISDEHRPSGILRTDFVSGNMPANKRKIKLDERNLRSAFTTMIQIVCWFFADEDCHRHSHR